MSYRKPATEEQIEATTKVYELRMDIKGNDNHLAKKLHISKNTLYTRLKIQNWTALEMAFIKTLKLKANEKA